MKFGKISKTSLEFYTINLVFLLFYFIWSAYFWDDKSLINDFNSAIFRWVCILFCVQITSFFIKKVTKYDFCLWFTLLSYLFMFGYLFRDYFTLQTALLWNPIVNYSQTELFHTYIYIIGSLELFSFGYLTPYNVKQLPKLFREQNELKGILKDHKVYTMGKILFLTGAIFTFIHDLPIILFMRQANTYESYSSAVSSGISGSLALFMLPGLFFLFFSGYLKERSKKILFFIVLSYLLLFMILTGSRKIQIFSITSLILAFNASNPVSTISIKKVIKIIMLLILGFFILTLLVTIRDYRFNLDQVVNGFIDNLSSFNILGILIGEIIAETGLTGLSVASIISVVPDYLPFQYGITFLRTIPSVLPIGWLLKDFFAQASSTYVINQYTGIPVGASMFGDLYWNFGYFGLIFSFIFGNGFYRLLNKRQDKKRDYNYCYNMALYFSLFSVLIILVRSEFFDIFRPLTYVYFFSNILFKFVK